MYVWFSNLALFVCFTNKLGICNKIKVLHVPSFYDISNSFNINNFNFSTVIYDGKAQEL